MKCCSGVAREELKRRQNYGERVPMSESGAVPPVGSRDKSHFQGSGAKPSKAEAILLIDYVIFAFSGPIIHFFVTLVQCYLYITINYRN